jgi:cytochrome c-type biogenesis protein CcmH
MPSDLALQRQIEEQFMCYCGCANLTVRACSCGTADQIRADIARRLGAGESADQVVAAYVAQHGEKIRSAPTTEGFSLLAWTMPFILLFVAGAVLVLLVRRWKTAGLRPLPATAGSGGAAGVASRPGGSTAPPSEADRRILERVRREIDEAH